ESAAVSHDVQRKAVGRILGDLEREARQPVLIDFERRDAVLDVDRDRPVGLDWNPTVVATERDTRLPTLEARAFVEDEPRVSRIDARKRERDGAALALDQLELLRRFGVERPTVPFELDEGRVLAGHEARERRRSRFIGLGRGATPVAALQRGEVDMIEQIPPDYITPLRSDPNVRLGSGGFYQGWIVMNQLHPPFNNAKARQAVLHAVNQEKFLAGMGYPLDMRMTYCATFFVCGSPNDTAAGAEPFRKPDIAKAKQLLAEAGYKGEKVVVLLPTDVPYLNAAALVTIQTLKTIGINVDAQSMDWSTVTARRAKKDAPEAGGWNVYVTVAGEFDSNSPITNAYLSAACGNSLPGWVCDKTLDELRNAWMRESTPAKRKEALDAFQKRAYEVVPYGYFGQYSPAYGVRKNILNVDKLWSIQPIWVLDK
ncbi:MAG: ABC transporter substrate-binding protein, partial [Burkholderiales bacterium]|nr:ABC transporter substrate-binding protein [Burkholderiales bacterium]